MAEPDENILITELYYHTHPRIKNEFITIYNPADHAVDLSGWHLTDQPEKTQDEQATITFPEGTQIRPKTRLKLTQNASAFSWETGRNPDFEYSVNEEDDIPQMNTYKTITLSNNGGAVALKDPDNNVVDIVVYGEYNTTITGWTGMPINDSGAGVILKRTFVDEDPIDTDTRSDWSHPRRYKIGQSEFLFENIQMNGELTTFVSPDCSYPVLSEALANASQSIVINMYEFTDPFLYQELVKALQRNVFVDMLMEGSPIGGMDNRETNILNRLANSGAEIRLIVQDADSDVYARYTYNHAKYLVIDETTVVVESCNWAKTGVPKDPSFGNREWGVIIRNRTIAAQFLKVFQDDSDLSRCDIYSFEEMNLPFSHEYSMDFSVRDGLYTPMFTSKTYSGNCTVTPVFSPDNSEQMICDLIDSAKKTICIEQLYVYKDWDEEISPFVTRLVAKARQGVNVSIILNYNPEYGATNDQCIKTSQYCEEQGINVKVFYTNWSYFSNVHNKGMIVDNISVLISSINWNENSVRNNREAGVIITNEDVARYYAEVFWYDWNLEPRMQEQANFFDEYRNIIYIAVIFILTVLFIAYDWRKRRWK